MGEQPDEKAQCVPLCGASRVYIRPQWWQHEALCPVRVEHRRAEVLAETAEHDAALITPPSGEDQS